MCQDLNCVLVICFAVDLTLWQLSTGCCTGSCLSTQNYTVFACPLLCVHWPVYTHTWIEECFLPIFVSDAHGVTCHDSWSILIRVTFWPSRQASFSSMQAPIGSFGLTDCPTAIHCARKAARSWLIRALLGIVAQSGFKTLELTCTRFDGEVLEWQAMSWFSSWPYEEISAAGHVPGAAAFRNFCRLLPVAMKTVL